MNQLRREKKLAENVIFLLDEPRQISHNSPKGVLHYQIILLKRCRNTKTSSLSKNQTHNPPTENGNTGKESAKIIIQTKNMRQLQKPREANATTGCMEI